MQVARAAALACGRVVAAQRACSSSSTARVLYQYASCPFCNKTRTIMDYVGMSYAVAEVNPMSQRTLKERLKVDKQRVTVPVLFEGDRCLGSSQVRGSCRCPPACMIVLVRVCLVVIVVFLFCFCIVLSYMC